MKYKINFNYLHILLCHLRDAQKYLKKHMEDYHGEKKHQCSDCGEIFLTDTKLKTHIGLSHDTSKLFECSICKAKVATKKYLNEHISWVHEKSIGKVRDFFHIIRGVGRF